MRWHAAFITGALVACTAQPKGDGKGITPDTHTFFPISVGSAHEHQKVTTCDSCHPSTAESFKDFTCVSCHIHDQGISDTLHRGVADYAFGEQTCLTCHPAGAKVPVTHTGITSGCATCHDVSTPFAALPLAGFTHPAMSGSDCGACHVVTSWKNASAAPNDSHDPLRDLMIQGLVPSWSGTTITRVTPVSQALRMNMNHSSAQVPAAAMSACSNCHADAATGVYYPGQFHMTLVDMALPEPTGCSDCHAATAPVGFVGPLATAPARTPPSGGMRHEAVAWVNETPGTQKLVAQDCQQCHKAPTSSAADATWATPRTGTGTVALFHASMSAAQQPSSCLDCHASSRPVTPLTLAGGRTLDHQTAGLLGECKTCHNNASAVAGTSWAGGTIHAAGAPAQTTCLPCHAGERPVSTTGWASATYRNSPFDYVTNVRGVTHGGGEDCAVCHTRTQDWTQGNFTHGPGTLSATQCVTCHTTQRPDLQPGATAPMMATLLGFDHSIDGTGDCFGCHQATVTAGSYVRYTSAATNMLPGGDWKNGVGYPGSFVSSTDQFITVTQTALNRSGPNNLVTSTTSVMATLYNGMLHTSPVLPAALNAGATGSPDYMKCWHCHTNNNGTVTAYAGGKYHTALTNYRPSPGAPIAAFPQPTTRCNDCHANMLPRNIVQKGTTNLQPMDHASLFTGTVNIGGAMVTGVAQLDCSVCHSDPGGAWVDGAFHSKIGNAVPRDCNGGCHYPLLADAAKADITLSTNKMAHRSVQVTFQGCERCHAAALSKAAMAPIAPTLWKTGAYHASLTTQPGACADCHTTSLPATALPGTVSYALTMGSSATNQPQFMNHASAALAGTDCVLCHATDAKASGSAWNRASKLHGPIASTTTCRECHGLTNGRGTVVGTNNNLPVGLTDSKTITTASAATGVAGVHDQLTHADPNVTGNDCKLCHTQQGASTAPGVQGKEWAQAVFHKSFTAATPLQSNSTTARCSNCHLNVKPGPGYTQQAHAGFTATSAQDCSSCHSWPGTNSATPNWLGATGAHASSGSTTASALDCNTCHGQGGSSSKRLSVPAASHYGGIANGNKCTSCHIEFTAFKGPVTYLKYAHNNATANAAGGCGTCHAFSGGLLTTLTTTPPLTFATAAGSHQFSQSTNVTGRVSNDTGPPRGSFTLPHTNTGLTRCDACHQYAATTATTNVWSFKHRTSNPGLSNSRSTPGCTVCHQ